jgi:hypothetical protein
MSKNNEIIIDELKESIPSRLVRALWGMIVLITLICCILIIPYGLLSYLHLSSFYTILILIIVSISLYFLFFRKAGIWNLFTRLVTPITRKTVISSSGIKIKRGIKVHEYTWSECEKIERNIYYSEDMIDSELQIIIFMKNNVIIELDEDVNWTNYQKIRNLSTNSIKEDVINSYKWDQEKGDHTKI